MFDYRGKKVVVMGLGMTGVACVDFFLARGVIPRVTDMGLEPTGLNALLDIVPRHLGSFNLSWIEQADLIIISPGIPLMHPALLKARSRGVEIIGDIELFCREAQADIVAITGSNGKSTVTTLVGEMAKEAGWDVGVGGNIGFPALKLLKASRRLYVLELSSFQLETTFSLKAAVATVLNLTEDHQDRYPRGIQQYRAAKARIYENAACCVVNAEDPLAQVPELTEKTCIYFGINTGDYCLSLYQKKIWLQIKNERVLDTEEMKLAGQHNQLNALAALAIAERVGIPRAAALSVLKEFKGLPHRFQLVHEQQGVRWINDSKSTNVGSTEAALRGLQVKGTLWLLVGGDGKSADFRPLIPHLQGDNLRLCCFGRDADQFVSLRPEIAFKAETLKDSMIYIASQVKHGDMVLLSPACASFDQFENFEQRGDLFSMLARALS